jgi:MOSC domain-containing protein YiiM
LADVAQINISPGGLPKTAVPQAQLNQEGLQGDAVRNRRVHGGPERAVCLYSLERIEALQKEGHPVFPGAMGENLTVSGLDWDLVKPGMLMRVGESALLEITRFTTPCSSLIPYFIDGSYGRVSQTLHPGWARVYARVLFHGVIRQGDQVILDSG